MWIECIVKSKMIVVGPCNPHFIYFLQGAVVDLSAQGLQKLDPSFTCSEDTYTLILDGNHIMKLDHMERNPGLQQVLKPFNSVLVFIPLSRFIL